MYPLPVSKPYDVRLYVLLAILGNQIFRDNNWLLVGDVVWLTYIVGQALIVFSPAAALRVLASLS